MGRGRVPCPLGSLRFDRKVRSRTQTNCPPPTRARGLRRRLQRCTPTQRHSAHGCCAGGARSARRPRRARLPARLRSTGHPARRALGAVTARTWPRPEASATLTAMRRIARNLGFFILTWAAVPLARTEETTPYSKTQAYNGALRFLRVEQELDVIEKDADLGYMLFEYPTGMGEEKTTGSVEVIEREDEVLVVVQISQLPSHHESRLVGALLKKL